MIIVLFLSSLIKEHLSIVFWSLFLSTIKTLEDCCFKIVEISGNRSSTSSVWIIVSFKLKIILLFWIFNFTISSSFKHWTTLIKYFLGIIILISLLTSTFKDKNASLKWSVADACSFPFFENKFMPVRLGWISFSLHA